MSYDSDFEVRAVCPCGARFEAPFGDKFHIHKEVCPVCGRRKSLWELRVERWVSTASVFKPWTWFDGFWEEKEL